MNTPLQKYSQPQTINLSEIIHAIIANIAGTIPLFSHIKPEKIHVCISSNKNGCRGATLGKLVPLKFEGGKDIMYIKGKCYAMPRIEVKGKPVLYLIYFYIPRFTDLSAIEKLRVIFHELFHIHPEFNGDIRRFHHKKHAHGHSKKKFDIQFEKEVHNYMKIIHNTEFERFLKLTTREIFTHYKRVFSNKMKMPRPILIK